MCTCVWSLFLLIILTHSFGCRKLDLTTKRSLKLTWTIEHACEHAIAAIEKIYLKKYDYCSKWYTSKNLKKTYNGVVNLVGDREYWEISKEIAKEIMKTPLCIAPKGRKRKTSYKSRGKFFKNTVTYSRCKRKNQNKRKYKSTP